ncbi:MAG TPA: ABC transporter ATP-binding protein [Candidatus Paceibacterota bacterium]|jgi:putative ABC transport system ATP-binding protein|nr:ABC transporter ATP-binding protein [Candidatus Paceibacterota bacterium]
MIKINNLSKIFQSGDAEIRAVDNVSFSIPEGQFVAITGRSGSGKSTLLYQLGLLDRPTKGEIFLDNLNATELSDNDQTRMRLHSLGYIFQDYAILPSLTALENVMVPLLMQGLEEKEAKEKSIKALSRVGLSDRMNNLPSQLSGGQQQRVSIARAIGHDPKIIFADEPTANLDSETSKNVLDAFLELNKEGQTIVMVTHEPEYSALAHRIIELRDGKIVSDEMNK